MNQAILLELLLSTIPYPTQICNIDLDQPNQVRFDWRGERYQITVELRTNVVEGSMLGSTNSSLLLAALLRKASDAMESKR